LLFSNDFTVLVRDFTDATDLSSSSRALDFFFLASMIFVLASGLNLFHSEALM
jgi:hypothetical protein